MAVAIASSSRTASTANETTIVLTKPTGLAVGDILLAYTFTDNGGGSAPSGWTAIGGLCSGDTSGFDLQFNAFAKIADADDVAASDFTFTVTLDNLRLGYLFRITGDFSASATVTDYIASDTDSNVTPSGTTATFSGGVTPLGANSLLLMATIGGATSYGGTNPFSAWAVANSNPSWTTQYNEGHAAGFTDSILASVVSATYTPATATGNYSVTESADNEVGGKLISINETTSVTPTPAVVTLTSSVQAPSVSGGASVSPAVVDITASVQAPTVTAGTAKWTNKNKTDTSPTIVNKNKS